MTEYNYDFEYDALAACVRSAVWGEVKYLSGMSDLYPLEHPLAGHCFVASEAYMVLSDRDLKPEHVTVEVPEPGPLGETAEFSHWYLRDRDTGAVVDLTAEQFTEYPHGDVTIPYDEGRGRGFGTHGACGNRTAMVLDAIAEGTEVLTELTP